MAYHIEKVTASGYRCSCCRHDSTTSFWVDDKEEALKKVPTEFPEESDYTSPVRVTVKDGGTGKVVAESKVTYAPIWQRGDGYKFTAWSRYVDEETYPDRGEYIHQIIEGVNSKQDPLEKQPLKLITDRTWSQLCDELQEAKRLADVRKAEAEIEAAQKKLAALHQG